MYSNSDLEQARRDMFICGQKLCVHHHLFDRCEAMASSLSTLSPQSAAAARVSVTALRYALTREQSDHPDADPCGSDAVRDTARFGCMAALSFIRGTDEWRSAGRLMHDTREVIEFIVEIATSVATGGMLESADAAISGMERYTEKVVEAAKNGGGTADDYRIRQALFMQTWRTWLASQKVSAK